MNVPIECFCGFTLLLEYKKEFAAPEEIHAREIVVPTEAAAKDILISLLQGGDFAAAAKEKSVSPSASKGGTCIDRQDRDRKAVPSRRQDRARGQ